MSKEKLIIAHSSENEEVAREIAHQLQYTGFDFQLVSCAAQGHSIKEELSGSTDNIILLLSDNFLKSIKCMDGGLTYLQKLINAGKTLPVVIDGKYKSQDGNGVVAVPTKFERVSSVIKYMNFWQDEYLEMRKQKRSIPAEKEEAFSEQLKSVRTISSEVGEFLRFLRDSYTCDYDTFSNNHFQVFFQKFSDQNAYNSFVDSVSKNPVATSLGTGMAMGAVAAVAANVPTTPKTASKEDVSSIVDELLEEEEVVPATAKELSEEALPLKEETELKTTIEEAGEIVKEKDDQVSNNTPTIEAVPITEQLNGSPPNEEAYIDETELLAQELANNLPDTGVEVPPIAEPEEELVDVETALEDLSKQQIQDLSNQQIAQEEAIMQDGLEMLGVAKATATQVSTPNNIAAEQKVTAPTDNLISESDLLRQSHELVQQGSINEGLRLLKTNLESRPDMIAARYQFAVFLAQFKNNYKAASAQLRNILVIEPTNLPANFFLGELAEAQRDFLAAKTYYETVEKINPDFPNLHYRLGLLLGRRYKDQANLAATHLHEAYAQNPRNLDALYNWGLVKNESLDQPKAALSAFLKVAAEDPKHPFVNYDLALAYYKMNDRVQAYNYYEKAGRINPELKTPENDLAFAIPEKEPVVVPEVKEEQVTVENATIIKEEPVSQENPDYTLDLSSQEEIQLEDLIKAEESSVETEEVDEEKLEAEFDATIGSLGAVGLGIAAGAAIETKEEAVSEQKEPVQKRTIKIEKTPTNIVLITGATSGIGKATAAIFAEKGYDLILTGRRFSRLLKLKEEFETKYSSSIQLLPFDVRSATAVQSAINELPEVWKNISVLINNAGLALGFDPIHEGNLEDWETMIDTNVKGLLYMTRVIAPFMVKQKKGHIINVSSIAGKEVYPNGNVYCASKHAVEALTKAMRIDLHQHNIRVSQIAPGHVEETEFAKVRFHGDTDRAKIYEDFIPVNSRDVAETIHFIATRPPHVNIQDILIMGTQQASATITDRSGR